MPSCPPGPRSTLATLFRVVPARIALAHKDSMIGSMIDHRQTLSVSNCQEEEEIAENIGPVDKALIDGITKFSIHGNIASANGSLARHHHHNFSSSDGRMEDCSLKGARIPLHRSFYSRS